MFDGALLPWAPDASLEAIEADLSDPINARLLRSMPLTEAAGGVLLDVGPYRAHGSIVGTISRTRSKLGSSTYFDGSATRYGQVSATPIISGRPHWTIAMYVRMASGFNSSNGAAFYCERPASGNDVVRFDGCATGGGAPSMDNIFATIRDDAGTLLQFFGTRVINDGDWHSIVWTKAGSAMVLYVDGTQEATATWSGTDTFTNSMDARLGDDVADAGAYTRGDFQALRLLARAWSPAEALRFAKDRWCGLVSREARIYSLALRAAASSGTTYNDSLTESLTLADALANVLTAVAAASASATAGDAVANAMTMPASASDAVTAGDSLANVLTALASASAAVTAGDAAANTLAMSASASDGATLGDGATGGLLQLASVSDGLTLSDGLAQALTAAVAAAGAVTVADALTTVLAATEAVSDAVALSDAVMAVLAMLASVSETVTLTDLLSEGGEPTWPAFVRDGRRVAIPPDLRRALIEMDRRRAAIPGDRRKSPLPN